MPKDDMRSFTDVAHAAVENIAEIVRSEVRLVRAETAAEAKKAARAGAVLASGVAFAMHALGFILLAATYGLAQILPPWVAALIVGGGVSLVAATLILIGWNRLGKVHAKPEKTMESMKENAQWLKSQTG